MFKQIDALDMNNPLDFFTVLNYIKTDGDTEKRMHIHAPAMKKQCAVPIYGNTILKLGSAGS